MVLECLYHSIELYLDNIITAFDGQTKAPDKLTKKSVFNHIAKIKKILLYPISNNAISNQVH